MKGPPVYHIEVYTDPGSFNRAMGDPDPNGPRWLMQSGYRIQQVIASPFPDLPHGIAVLWAKAEK